MRLRGVHASLCDQCRFESIKASLEVFDFGLLGGEFTVLFGAEITQGFDHECRGGTLGDEAGAVFVA